jgi:hypothetical protein
MPVPPTHTSTPSNILAKFITFYRGLVAPPARNAPHGVPLELNEGNAKMKSWLWQGMLAAAIAWPALNSAA